MLFHALFGERVGHAHRRSHQHRTARGECRLIRLASAVDNIAPVEEHVFLGAENQIEAAKSDVHVEHEHALAGAAQRARKSGRQR